MMNTRLCLIILTLFFNFNSYAQKRKGKFIAKKVTEVAVNIDSLMSNYLFEEASEAIQKKILQTQKQNESIFELEKKAEEARKGINMMSATAKIVFIDSFIVKKDQMFNTIKLAKSCGVINRWDKIFENGNIISKEVTLSGTYTNEFGDKLVYSYPDSTGHTRLFNRFMVNGKWSDPEALLGIGNESSEELNPYLLSDGTTLYFAQQGEESLGKLDIFITRYNSDTKKYMKPENLGMPFNSPANEFFMIIDEQNNLGWLASDRCQSADNVCIYVFIPEESRNVYEIQENNMEDLRHKAMIHDIASTQIDKNKTLEARQRLKNIQVDNSSKNNRNDFQFIIYNDITYYSINDFKSAKAKQLAENWRVMSKKQNQTLYTLNQLRSELASGANVNKTDILKHEQALIQLDEAIKDLEWNIRYEEQSKIGVNK